MHDKTLLANPSANLIRANSIPSLHLFSEDCHPKRSFSDIEFLQLFQSAVKGNRLDNLRLHRLLEI